MHATEKQVTMAAQLYDMRDKSRRLLGDKYKSHMAELGRILKMTADRDNKSALEVAIDVSKKRVEIADESAGEFVEVKQRGRVDIGKIQINPEEWPALRETIDRMIAECRSEPGVKNNE